MNVNTIDYYAKRLATCSSDYSIKIFEIIDDQQFQYITDLIGHQGPVWQITWGHPKFGSILASCSLDGKIILHRENNPGEWQNIYAFNQTKTSVNSIAWAPYEYGLCLAGVTSDGVVIILSHRQDDTWNTITSCATNKLSLNSVSWAPFNSNSPNEQQRLVTGGSDHEIRIWKIDGESQSINSCIEETILPSIHTDWIRDVAWAPSIGLPHRSIASGSEDGKAIIWTQKTPKSKWEHMTIKDNENLPVWRVSWSFTGNILAISAGDSEVTLWKEAYDGKGWNQVKDVSKENLSIENSYKHNENQIKPDEQSVIQPSPNSEYSLQEYSSTNLHMKQQKHSESNNNYIEQEVNKKHNQEYQPFSSSQQSINHQPVQYSTSSAYVHSQQTQVQEQHNIPNSNEQPYFY